MKKLLFILTTSLMLNSCNNESKQSYKKICLKGHYEKQTQYLGSNMGYGDGYVTQEVWICDEDTLIYK